ncbi:hypothetical protein GCM10010172_64340 [Paractinoplanes ferrugineus]|uniref:Uncharacterized protein n=1 Tax=Paractinoplanes ferrugineus TaxID=113564 RepID=A0A919JF15_9ACTN|nr:hypothetical protein Afe05nite_78360 [Actinoplanes ferrugineus]
MLAAALLVLAGGTWTLYSRNLIFKDSGIKACTAMRDGTSALQGGQPNARRMTEQQYRELRAVFEDSRYDDIRRHGTRLTDLVWQMSQGPEADGTALGYLQPLTEHLTGLQSACADQGVFVTLQPAAAYTGERRPERTAVGRCSDVFRGGKVIDQGAGAGRCLSPAGEVQAVASFGCTDGRKLYELDATSGAAGYGFSGSTFEEVDGDLAADAGYRTAVRSCLG